MKARLKMNNIKDFGLVFQITKKIIFEVEYYHCGSNKEPYFSTSVAVFNQPKTDYNRCGQCQPDVLKGQALKFWKKWDRYHLHKLTAAGYNALLKDIEDLKACYNFIEVNPNYSNFYKIKELSKQALKIR